MLLLTVLVMASCAVNSGKRTVASSNPQLFDQKLADSLGADQYGMKNYFLVILKTGAKDKEITEKTRRAELFKGHFSNMNDMEKSGKLKLAGPFSTANHLGYRGIFLLDVKSEEEAQAMLQNDPTVKAGIFEADILPWYGSAAIPMHLDYHKKNCEGKSLKILDFF